MAKWAEAGIAGKKEVDILSEYEYNITVPLCDRGGIDIRARLKGVFLTEYKFRLRRSHHKIQNFLF